MHSKHIQLVEAILVDQQSHPLARAQLTAAMLRFRRASRAIHEHIGLLAPKLGETRVGAPFGILR
jgi:hypothetical protein